MGKTAKGAIWLTPEHLSDYDYWQFWRNTQDSDVGHFLKLFTELPLDEISRLEKLEGQELNEAKKILANEATALCRGADAAKKASETARKTFEEGESGDLPNNVEVDVKILWHDGYALTDAILYTGLRNSKKETRRVIEQGGVKVNGQKITDVNFLITIPMGTSDIVKISVGKKSHAIIIPFDPKA